MDNKIFLICIGFLAQGCFSARILVQWILSERSRRVLSPASFWLLSLCGSCLFFLYGWWSDDFSIILGQMISYYIYVWNLKIKGLWDRLFVFWRYTFVFLPIVALFFVVDTPEQLVLRFFHNENVPMWLLLLGSVGQVLFTLRFIYQWLYSKHKGESALPAGFWLMSLTGASLIVTYGFLKGDIVLIVGHSFGIVAYARNLMLIKQSSGK